MADHKAIAIPLVLAALALGVFLAPEKTTQTVVGEIQCRTGNYAGCARAAAKLERHDESQALELHQRVCQSGKLPWSCTQAARLQLKTGDVESSLHDLLQACRGGGKGACYDAASAATDAALPMPATQKSKISAAALEAGRLGCDQLDGRACLFAATQYLLKGDRNSEYNALKKGCTQLRNPNSCARLAKYLYYWGKTDAAVQTALHTCGGKRDRGCEDLFPELFHQAEPFGTWARDFIRTNYQWDKLMTRSYTKIMYPKVRLPASWEPRQLPSDLGTAEIALRAVRSAGSLLPGLAVAQAKARQSASQYLDLSIKLSDEARRLLALREENTVIPLADQKALLDLVKAAADAYVLASQDLRSAGVSESAFVR